MKKLVGVLAVCGVAALVMALPAAATRTVHINSSVTLGATLTTGQVSAANAACKPDRKVVVKYRDKSGKSHVFGRGTTNDKGRYTITPGATPGQLPFIFTATVKRSSEGTAGTIYVCDQATSKPRKINGG